jgi:hypothetical protein
MDRAPFESTNEVEQADLVDEFYIPLVRALGNLVILFAQAEADLIDLLAELNGGNERAAHDVLKSPTAEEEIITLLEASGIQGFDLRELIAGINTYWSDKERRNRYMHDEWYVGGLSAGGAVPATRGLPRRKGSDVVWDNRSLGACKEVSRLQEPILSRGVRASAE